MKTISDLLGHKSIRTTFVYTKTDLKHLRLVAHEWPEVVQ
jgi:site-specific recombinase XerC